MCVEVAITLVRGRLHMQVIHGDRGTSEQMRIDLFKSTDEQDWVHSHSSQKLGKETNTLQTTNMSDWMVGRRGIQFGRHGGDVSLLRSRIY